MRNKKPSVWERLIAFGTIFTIGAPLVCIGITKEYPDPVVTILLVGIIIFMIGVYGAVVSVMRRISE